MQGEYLILDLRSLCWKGLVEYPLGRIVQYCELLLTNRISNNSRNETGRWQTFKVQRYDQGVISWCDWHPNAFRRPHCRACKWRIHEMIQSETLSYGLFSHRRYYFHWLYDNKFSQPCKTTKMDEIPSMPCTTGRSTRTSRKTSYQRCDRLLRPVETSPILRKKLRP